MSYCPTHGKGGIFLCGDCVEKRIGDLEANMEKQALALQEAQTVLEHAIELGYFNEGGSTEGMAKEALAKIEQVYPRCECELYSKCKAHRGF